MLSVPSRGSGSTSGSSSEKSAKSLFALRTGLGTNGRKYEIFANHFPMKYTSDVLIYHYDVDIEPMRLNEDMSQLAVTEETDFGAKFDKKRFRKLDKLYRIVMEEAFKTNSNGGKIFDGVLPVYDGQKNLYAKKELNLADFAVSGDEKRVARIKVDVNEDGRSVMYAIYIKLASIIDMNHLKRYFDRKTDSVPMPSDAIQVLNIILRHGPTLYKIPIGNSLYFPSSERGSERKDIGGGRLLVYGYFQSVRPDANGVSLVIDRTATSLYDSGILPKFIAKILKISREDFMNLKGFSDFQRKLIEKELKGITIQVKHLTYKRKYRVIGLTREAAKDVTFEMKKTDPRGNETSLGVTSVVDFFAKHYPNMAPLKFTHLPCVTVGSTKNPNYLPLDICELVPDQHVRNNLTEDQMIEMIRSSASQSPENRLKFIRDSAQSTIQESKIYMKEFGINVTAGSTPLTISARIMTPPALRYGNSRDLTPMNGKWELRNHQFYRPAQLKYWLIIRFGNQNDNKLELLERTIRETGSKLGMDVSTATRLVLIPKANYSFENVIRYFENAKKMTENKVQIIFFVVSPQMENSYERIKKIGDIDFGIPTQCIKETNLDNLKPPLMQNIMLKVNTKLGGINAVLQDIEILRRRTMIVGIDCSHPGVGDRVTSSVSACVASFDNSYVRYFATTRKQKHINEIGSELQQMMKEMLEEYETRNDGELPEQIVIYRDGVSEGQFNAALQQEIKGLNEAFKQKHPNYEPSLTYIVVQKRHHTRFFPQNPAEGVGRARNVPPGLVVDTDVVSNIYFDYFLCSHEGIQGTSRPSHYYVLWDDSHYSADVLQQLTYCLSYVYTRCTRSISYPAPVAYAHLAAYRAQKHAKGAVERMRYGSESSKGLSSQRQDRDSPSGLDVKTDFKSRMYFC